MLISSPDIMGNIGCVWTPEDLDIDDLYALWLSEGGADDQSPSFAISPPWKLREPVRLVALLRTRSC